MSETYFQIILNCSSYIIMYLLKHTDLCATLMNHYMTIMSYHFDVDVINVILKNIAYVPKINI